MRDELQLLRDRQAILDCVTGYARGLDRHDVELLTSVFHEDAIDHHGHFIGTRDEFVPWANALHEADWGAHTHFITNNTIEIDGDVAHSECYLLFALRHKDGSGIHFGGGRYIDRLERRVGEWRIAARELLIDWYCEADSASHWHGSSYPHGTWDRTDAWYRRPFELVLPSGERDLRASNTVEE